MSSVIEVERVGKRYWQLHEQAMLLKSVLPGRGTQKTEHWALRDLSFTVQAGEVVGVLGHNGAGKTTLLRMLAGVSRPTEGTISVTGRVAPLISVGVGFHPEMSGRENVFVNGMLLGLTRRQIREKFDDIVAFAELQDFIDTPVKFYSTGMFMRLGFSIAVHVEPDVMLVDEVLAVGDTSFQLKCFERIRSLQGQGTTILLVSHSMHAIRLLCPRALLIRHGKLEADGPAEEVIGRHHELMSIDEFDRVAPSIASTGAGLGAVTVTRRSLETPHGPTHHPPPGSDLHYRVGLRFNVQVDSPHFEFRVTSESGVPCYYLKSVIGRSWKAVQPGDEMEVDFAFCARLGGGTYRLTMTVLDREGRTVLLTDTAGTVFYVVPRLGTEGIADLEASIQAEGTDLSIHESLLLGDQPMTSTP